MNNNRKNNNRKRRNNRSNNNQTRRSRPHKKSANNSNRNRNSGKKSSQKKDITKPKLGKFHQLFSEYLMARKNYYQAYRGTMTKKVERLQRNYSSVLKRFWDMKKNLPDNELKKLEYELDFYPNDSQYSLSRPDEKALIPNTEEKLSHIHLFHETNTQKSRSSFKDDQEESIGTMEDYNKYKENI